MLFLASIFGPLPVETVLQLALSILLGGAVGLERQLRGRAAGLRTMSIVCLGSTLIMIVSARIADPFVYDSARSVLRVDPGRIAAGIVTGVGFLGAGVVLKLRDLVRGVTTAACIWFVAGVGIAIGQEHYGLALTATLFCLLVLWGFQFLDHHLTSPVYRTVTIQSATAESPTVVERTTAILESDGIRIMDVHADTNAESGTARVTFRIRALQHYQAPAVVARLSELPGVISTSWR
ncbi:MAG TPA: MgtC/SapB family protein [Planctomycetes bacterium]|nr:MgtC/SapB family protein [Planctomycetota bacterium]